MRHSLTRILPYTPQQLFDLVGDVEAYPQFVPWITSMRVWNRHDDGAGISGMDAEAGVGFSFLRETFSTRVKRDEPAGEITVTLIHGPFKHLINRWRFFRASDWNAGRVLYRLRIQIEAADRAADRQFCACG